MLLRSSMVSSASAKTTRQCVCGHVCALGTRTVLVSSSATNSSWTWLCPQSPFQAPAGYLSSPTRPVLSKPSELRGGGGHLTPLFLACRMPCVLRPAKYDSVVLMRGAAVSDAAPRPRLDMHHARQSLRSGWERSEKMGRAHSSSPSSEEPGPGDCCC